jgi:PAS domain S-box-containing protein
MEVKDWHTVNWNKSPEPEGLVEQLALAEVVRELGLLMSASLATADVLQAILEAVFTLLPTIRNTHIFIVRNGTLEFGAARWADGREGPAFTPRPEGMTHTVARTGERIAVADMQKDPLYAGAPPAWTGRIVGLPLTSDGRVVGVMNVSGSEARAWTEKELHTLELLAGQAAIAIRNAHLYEEARAQLAARQQVEEAYQNLVNNSPVGLLLLHADRIAFANPAMVEILGRSADELNTLPLGELLRACVHREDRRELVRLVRGQLDAAAGSEPARHELRVLHRDGSERYLSGYIAPTHYAGQPAVQIVTLDVTAQRQAAARLRQLSRAVEQSPASIIITDAKGDIEYVNPRFSAVSGYSYDEAIGRNPRFLKSGVLGPDDYRALWGTISSGREWRGELCNVRKDGSLYWESASISPILNEAGEITHYLAVKEDITEKKAGEEALRASQQLLERTFNSLQDAVFIVDAEERIIDCNPAVQAVFGYLRTEVLGLPFAQLHLSVLRAETYLRRVQAATAAHGLLRRAEMEMRRRDGSRFPTEMTTAPLYDAEGAQTGWVTVVRDISERKAQEVAIQNRNKGLEFINAITSAINRPVTLQQVLQVAVSEMMLRLPVDGAELVLLDEAGAIVEAARRGLDEWAPVDAASLAPWRGLRRPARLNLVEAAAGNARAEAAEEAGYKLLLVVPLLREEAQVGLLLLYCRAPGALPPEMEQVLFITGAQLVAAVERARLFEAERAQREHMEALTAAATTINSSLELPVVLEEILVALGKVIAYDTASVILRDGDVWRVYAGRGLPPGVVGMWTFADDNELTQRMVRTQQPVILDDARTVDSFRVANGQITVRGWMGIPLVVRERMIGYLTLDSSRIGAYGADDAAYAVGFAQQAATAVENARLHADLRAQLAALEAAQERLVQSEKLAAIGELVAGVAHELNNPLSAVMLYAQLLQQKGVATGTMKRDLDRIVEQAQRASNIVQSLLDFARQRTPIRKVVRVEELVRKSLALIRYELNTHNIGTHLEAADGLPPTMADPHQLQQVLVNLFTNAYQAMYQANSGGSLTVTVTHGPSRYLDKRGTGEVLRVAVADTGPGIDPGLLSRIFDPFFTTKEPGDGTGLGLSVCHGIVREHGGHIWADSVLGQGSTFYVELPVVAAAEGPPGDSYVQATPAPPARLLVIDDEPAVRETLARVLEDSGYEVATVGDGTAALEALKAEAFDLILCDMRMPGLSGPAFYEAVLDHDPAVARRILFSTGDLVSQATRDFLAQYDVPLLAKPFTIEMLLSEVEGRLAGE